ncbi:MAG TPA: hypothetical protein VFS04_06580, partial [Alphaproteobacteria bacterium]|nr:hypothetical protein [Alphaproteobacteria bacterium]
SATTGGSITLTASASLFTANDVGRSVRMKHTSTWGWARILAYTDATHVTASVQSTLGGTTATAAWQFGAWQQAGSYPACVSFYEERLFFAGSRDKPQTIWASRSGDFENFAPTETDGTLADDCALSFTIATDQVNAIRWLSPGAVLAVGTVGGEFTLRASAQDEPLTPANVQVKRQTTRGCAYQPPIQVDSVVLFLQRAGRKIREFVFAFETDGYQAPDLTLLAEHLTRGGGKQMAYMREPDSTLWAARADGLLLGMTYERPQEVVAWHRHILGGAFGDGPAKAESLAVIPAPGGGEDQLWLAVARTIGGETRRHIEFLEAPFEEGQSQADAFFVDCGLTYDGARADVIAGLDHLEGETVAVLADGAVHPERLVGGGEIELDWPAAKAQVGLPYRSRLQTMRFEAGAQDGTAQGKTARIHAATVRLWNSLGVKLGADDALETLPFRNSSDAMDAPPALFTGDKRVAFPKGYGTAPRVTVAQDQPLPLTVLAIMPRLNVFDG